MGGAATGDKSSRASVDEEGKMWGTSGRGVQKIYKNTTPIFTGSGVLCKVDTPLNCRIFVCSSIK